MSLRELIEMIDREASRPETVIPFPNGGDALDRAGQAACDLVQRAAGVAEEQAQLALAAAHKLSVQLRAAEDQIAELKNEVKHYRDRADRAEKWLHRIAMEIEDNFFADRRPRQSPSDQGGPKEYAPKRRGGSSN
jgi:hypothetical protein